MQGKERNFLEKVSSPPPAPPPLFKNLKKGGRIWSKCILLRGFNRERRAFREERLFFIYKTKNIIFDSAL